MGDDYLTVGVFNDYCIAHEKNHVLLLNALWGSEGTNGIVKDVHDLKMWIKFIGITGSIITPVATAFIIKFILGGV